MVATNTGGARMLRHGDVRRRVLGVEVVTADRDVTVLDTLSVLRKDNTGPDLTSLFVGSAGMFGVVCRVALDLARIPAHTAGMVVVPADGAAAVDLLTGLEEDLGDLLSAFEVMSAPAMDAALRHVDGLHHPFGGSPLPDLAVLVEVAGPVGLDDLLLGAVGRAVQRGVATEAVAMPLERAWALRHSLTEGLRRSGVVVGFDVSVPRPALAAYRDAVRTEVAVRVPRAVVADFGHWGDGGMHCNLVFPPGAGPDERGAGHGAGGRVRPGGGALRGQLQRGARAGTPQRRLVAAGHPAGHGGRRALTPRPVRSPRDPGPPRPAPRPHPVPLSGGPPCPPSNGARSRAGTGSDSREPWPRRHPRSRRRSSWGSVSMPSATVSRPMVAARLSTAVTMAVSSPSAPTPATKDRSSLTMSMGRRWR